MKKVILISVVCCICVFLASCVTVKKTTQQQSDAVAKEPREEKQTAGMEYGRLVFIGEECVGWFSSDLTIIGSADMGEYIRENKIKPTERAILDHFVSLGWEVAGKKQPDAYTVEYKLKRSK